MGKVTIKSLLVAWFIVFFGFVVLPIAVGIEPENAFSFHQPNEPKKRNKLNEPYSPHTLEPSLFSFNHTRNASLAPHAWAGQPR